MNQGPISIAQSEELSSQEYEIQQILNKKIQDGEIHYQIWWKGYPKTQSTWEPKRNLVNSKDAIRAYEKKIRRNTQNVQKDRNLFEDEEKSKKQNKLLQKKQSTPIVPRKGKGQDQPTFEIVGLKTREIQFKVRYEDGKEEYIKNSKLKQIAPHKLIKFYQSRIKWSK